MSILAVVLAISLVGVVQAVYSTDIADDFSLAANPNGDWSYGWFDGARSHYNNQVSSGPPANDPSTAFYGWTAGGDWDTHGNMGINSDPNPIDFWTSFRVIGAFLGGSSVIGQTNAA